MSSTLLQLMQQTSVEMGLSSPSTVIGNSNQDVTQTLALMQAVGYELQRQWQWQALTIPYTFTSVFYTYTGDLTNGSTTISNLSSTTGLTATPTYFQVVGTGINNATNLVSVNSGAGTAVMNQAATASGTGVTLTFSQVIYSLPSDYDRLIDRTDWDKSQHWEMLGPETQQQSQWLKSGYISTGPRVRYWLQGNAFQIWPALGAAHSLGFVYVSNLWVTATGGTAPTKTSFTVDSDTCIFPDRLMVLGTKLKYFEIKGFDTTALYRDYTMQLDLAKAHDAGSPTLSFAPKETSILVGYENIPDANYGS
jgi:hypothetical protein